MVTLKWSLVFDKMSSLLHGCAVTMEISILTLIFGTVLGVSAGADARQPREDRGKDRTALYLDLERNSSYDTGIPDLFRTAQPGSHIQRHDSRRALHVIKYRRIHCGNRSLRYPCY